MAVSIKDKVAIVGMGCTKFGELWDKSSTDLVVDAAYEAYEDAGIEPDQIDAAWGGTVFQLMGIVASVPLRLKYKPVTRVENACATGSEAIRGACYALASGVVDVALAIGVEKLKDFGPHQGAAPPVPGANAVANFSAPGIFALLATRYFARYGLTPEEGKTMLAKISVKSHYNGSLNPKAHLRRVVTVDQVLNAPMIAWPLGLFDCCGVSDGAAAAIMVRAEDARKYRPDPVYIKAIQVCVGYGRGNAKSDYDYTGIDEVYHAGQRAYEEAGVENPREEISMAEVHDCFSITEAVLMEDLQFSPRGRVKEDIESGFFELTGGLPVQPDGGLKSFGHPIGASGIRMVYEMYKQLQGKAEERQLKDPKLGLTHNLGGFPGTASVAVAIVGL